MKQVHKVPELAQLFITKLRAMVFFIYMYVILVSMTPIVMFINYKPLLKMVSYNLIHICHN